ncbi:DMT family transporter [Sulfurospirillum arcachonense]|uniref:DMT family transporter n=1 Tax=Sulfurospirillum arcachonense TaxID=57666 RepID=UPI0004AEE77D
MIRGINTGVKYMFFASFCFAIMGAFAKELSAYMDPLEVVFFRNVIGVIIVGLSFLKMPVKQVGGKPFLLFFRGFMGFMALVAFFYNIAHIPLADAMTFSRTSPMFTALLSFWFLKEKLVFKELVALLVGFAGVVFIMKPNGLSLDLTDVLGLISGVGAALAYTSVKELKKFYDTRMIVLSFMLTGTIGPILLIVFNDALNVDFLKATFIMPDLKMWIFIGGLGLSATVAQVFMTKAYGFSKAGVVGAVSYANIIFSLGIGLMMGDALPDALGACGIGLVILGGILVARAKD